MSAPDFPPLNGRNLAEYYVAGEAAKLSTLREYAKPLDDQQARILMYDPIRRIVPEYFRSGRNPQVLDRIARFLENKHFPNAEYDATYHKSNTAALDNLKKIQVNGEFRDVVTAKSSITTHGIRVLSTVDFYATFIPKAANGIVRRVGVIVNPSGVKRPPEKRKQWLNIESEVAFQAATATMPNINAIMYLDLQKHDVNRHIGPKTQIKAEIDATCYRILRDWKELRLLMHRDGTGTA